MIGNNSIQAAIISKLKADVALTAWLTLAGSSDEIREAQWQGTDFELPAVRVNVGINAPFEDSCYPENCDVAFIVSCFSEEGSSSQVDQLMHLVCSALIGKRLTGSGWSSLSIRGDGNTGAVFDGEEKVWRSFSAFSMFVVGG